MGVVSNKINIMELQKSSGGGDPTIPGRVSALENEMTGVYASINQISTVELPKVYSSINEISTVELPKVYSSISAVSDLILKPVTGLEDRVEALETSNTEYESYSIDNSNKTKTNAEVLTDMYNHFKTIGANYRYCEVDYIDISGNIGNINTTIFNTTVPFMLGVSSYTVKNTGLSNPISPHMTTAIVGGIFTVQTFGYMMASIDLGSSTKSIVTYDTITQTNSGTTTNTQNVIDENNTTEIIKSITVRYKPMVKR